MTTVEPAGSAEPVGQQGARVDIRQQPCAGGQRLARRRGALRVHRRDGGRRPGRHRMALGSRWSPFCSWPARSLVIVPPGQGSGGPVLRPLRRHGRAVRGSGRCCPYHAQATGQRAGPQFRDRPPQGQRRGRQPGRDRGDRGLAGRRHREGDLRRRQLRRTSSRCRRSRPCVTSRPAIPYDDSYRHAGRPCAAPPTSSPAQLAREVAERVAIAGVEIVEVRISHLAYAAEIAQAMLRRQQANAVVAARIADRRGRGGDGGDGAQPAERRRRRLARRGADREHGQQPDGRALW